MLTVSCPDDPLEREAEAVAARVARGDVTVPDQVPGRITGTAPGAPSHPLPESVLRACQGGGVGVAIPANVRLRLEPQLRARLDNVRVRQDGAAARAARDLGARAFTSGSTIYLAAGSSPSDIRLMAHEVTHVVQQGAAPRARTTVLRAPSDYLPSVSVTDLIPQWVLDGISSTIRAVPGYTLLSYLTGQDPLTGEPVQISRAQLVESFLTFGPFAVGAGPVLSTLNVLEDVFSIVSADLAAHNLTLARVSRDIQSAIHEFSIDKGISGNVAVVRRYLDAILNDIKAFAASIADRVIALIRSVVARIAEPALQTPTIAPIWNLARKVLHYDPLKGEPVEAPTTEILADFLRLIGQEERLAQMQERGTLQETADWLDTQFATFASLAGNWARCSSEAWDAIQPQNLASLPQRFPELAAAARSASSAGSAPSRPP